MAIRLDIHARCAESRARSGTVTTPHGTYRTPAFMPVGTQGTVKGLLPPLVRATGSEIILGNTYHLMLRPGPEVVRSLGGLHGFAGWNGPMLTDSGGFQAFSLSDTVRLTDEAVVFASIVDGSMIELTPERPMAVQNARGANIIMAHDDCPPGVGGPEDARSPDGREGPRRVDPRDYAKRLDESNDRTARWLERCARAHARKADQALFGIVQGGTDLDRRTRSVEQVCAIDLPGYAIGGVAVGEGFAEILSVVRHTAPLMPEAKPRYLMGVGYERDIVAAVRAGVDMFDCVLPTRNGRNANAFTPTGQVRLRNAGHATDAGPIDPACDCIACSPAAHGWETPGGLPISRGYLRHLFQAGEMLGPILVSLHNVRHFQRLMVDIRAAIEDNGWSRFGSRWPVAADALL